MPRSVYSAVGRGGPSRFNPINLGKRFAVSVLAASLGLLGMASVAGAATAVTAVSFTPGATIVGLTSTWAVDANLTTAVSSGQTITVTMPSAFTDGVTPTTTVHQGNSTVAVTSSAFTTSGTVSTDVITLGANAATGATVITIATVVNPNAAASYANTLFGVATQTDSTVVNPSTGVAITAAQQLATPTAVTAGLNDTLSTPTASAAVTFTAGSGGLAGTYTVETYDSTTGAPVAVPASNVTTGSIANGKSDTVTISGLTVGDIYQFDVVPTSAQGYQTSAKSAGTQMTTALAQPTVANASSGAITVSFVGDGVATTYTVNTYVYNPSTGATTASPNNSCTLYDTTPLAAGASGSCTVGGLTNGNYYEFTVTPSGASTDSTVSAMSAPIQALTALTAPVATTAGSVLVNNAQVYNVAVSFTADGVAALYTVQAYSTSGGLTTNGTLVSNATCSVANTSSPLTGSQSCTISGLAANTEYYFVVTPSGNNDPTQPSTSNYVTTGSALATPTAKVSGPDQVTVSFYADGVATLYTVNDYVNGTITNGVGASGTANTNVCFVANSTTPPTGLQTCTVSGLTADTKYAFNVSPSGNSTLSTTSLYSAQVTATDALAMPTVANAGAQSVKVTFTADGAALVYTVTAHTPAGAVVPNETCLVANTTTPPTGTQSCTVTGLANNTAYRFGVAATTYPSNYSGTTSGASPLSVGITTVSPIVITGVAGAGSGAVTVTFTPDGVATTYLVNSYIGTSTTPAAQTCTVVSTTAIPATPNKSCTVTGLSNGTAYTFTVTPSGNGTTSVMSAASSKVTPGTGLATPTAVASGSGQATVSFATDGVASVYTVNAFLNGTGNSVGSCVVANTATPPTGTQSCTVTGLTNGDSYTFSVTPSGNNTTTATSAPSAAIKVTNALATPTVKNAGSGAILVSFVADGVASTYTVNAYLNGTGNSVASCVVANTTKAPTGAQSCTVSGLSNGATYTFTVTPTGNATNSGVSLASSSIMVGTTFLATPTVTWGGSGAAAVSFTADGVASTYVVTASTTSTATGIVTTGSCTVANSTTAPTGTQTCTVTGLSNGTAYTFVVTPSGNGTSSLPSAPSASFTVTAAVAPSAVTAVTTTTTANSITVNWTAPTSTGNSALTGYVVTATAGNTTTSCGTVAGTATSCTISGLSASTVYVVSVSAVNAAGTSAAATASATTAAAPVAKNPFTSGVHGVAYVGRTVTLTISGGNFYGQPAITSNNPGTRVGVKSDTGTALTLVVTTSASAHTGWHTFTITFANGKVARANYDVK